MLEVKWRPRAHLDRESIAVYLGVECGNTRAALSAMWKIDAAIAFAREFPDAGRRFFREGVEGREYRIAQSSPYLVYCRFDDEALTVYRVLHERRSIDDYALIDF